MPSYKTCFDCGEAVDRNATICPHCDSELPDVSKLVLPSDPAPSAPPAAAPAATPARRGRPLKKAEAPVVASHEPPATYCLGYRLSPHYLLVSTPAGKPHAAPRKDGDNYSTKEEDVRAWVEEVIQKGWEKKVRYSAGALLYWGRYYFWRDHDDCLEVKRIIYGCFEEPSNGEHGT